MKHFRWSFLLCVIFGCGRPVQVIEQNGEVNKEDLLFLHNKERTSHGNVSSLKLNHSLSSKAQEWAESMARMDILTHSELKIQDGFGSMGENIASGYQDVDSVMKGWMNSSGHRRNILNQKFSEVGFGYAKRQGRFAYWCVQFGGR
jgi:uncharacterized protein YkwD